MSYQYRTFAVTIPAGTPIAAPVTRDISFPPFHVDYVEVIIPPGPLGQMGFRIASSRTQWVPWNPGSWIIANDVTKVFNAEGWPDSGDWQIIGYNTGVFDHGIEVTFALDPIGVGEAALAVPNVIDLSTVAPIEAVS
jgi:hypothetical protein